MELSDYVARHRERIDRTLDRLLPDPEGPARTVIEAARHAVMGGGKRLRPILVLSAYEACHGEGQSILEPACAIELIHTYSLVHDDLPAMDDDDLRRGRPTVHRAFGDAAAVLAGDALLTLAFEILGRSPEGAEMASRRAEAVVAAACGAGFSGMVGGQMADLEAERRPVGADDLRWIHLHKTAALIAASCRVGAILAGAAPPPREALAAYGRNLGLAFQIADDLLDRTGTAGELGKTPGKDERAGKATYPGLMGIEASRRAAEELVADAIDALRTAGVSTSPLEQLAAYAVDRRR